MNIKQQTSPQGPTVWQWAYLYGSRYRESLPLFILNSPKNETMVDGMGNFHIGTIESIYKIYN